MIFWRWKLCRACAARALGQIHRFFGIWLIQIFLIGSIVPVLKNQKRSISLHPSNLVRMCVCWGGVWVRVWPGWRTFSSSPTCSRTSASYQLTACSPGHSQLRVGNSLFCSFIRCSCRSFKKSKGVANRSCCSLLKERIALRSSHTLYKEHLGKD